MRKAPQRSERRHPKKALDALPPPSAVRLPTPDAGFAAWGQASERARQEFNTAWQRYRLHAGDEKLQREAEAARQLWYHTLDRAYPAGFWEGIADLHAGKTETLEIYITFLEADPLFFRSGYAKSELIRGLKRVPLTLAQQRRLQNVVLQVMDKGFRREFRDYCRLARHVQSTDWLQEVETRLSFSDPKHALRAQWILDACRRK